MRNNKHLTRKFLSISITTALAVGTMQAHALIEAPLRQNATAQNIVRQADTTGAVLDVNKAQTARTPVDIGNARLNIEAQRMVAQTAVETAKEIKENIDAITPGIGVSRSSNCIVQKEHKKHVEKQDLSNQVRKAVAGSQAAKFYKSSGDKRAARATDHYMNYCDVSEAKYGNCLPAVNGRGGANTDYGNIANNLTLTSEQISAGYSYIQNIVDPSKTDLSQCETIACRALEMKEAQYHAIGSMIQNAFLNQIQDSIAYDVPPGGVKTITVEQLGELSAPWDGRLAKWDESASDVMPASSDNVDTSNLPSDMQALRELLITAVAAGEAASGPKGWNASNNGTIGKKIVCGRASGGVFNLTSMTVGEVMSLQARRSRPSSLSDCSGLFAAGRFQMIPSTLKAAVAATKTPKSAIFNEETQKRLAGYLVDQRIGEFMKGNRAKTLDGAKLALAKEWASLGIPGHPGTSHYGGANKAKASVTKDVWAILVKMDSIRFNK